MVGFKRVLRWVKSLVGTGPRESAPPEVEGYACAVCGTPVEEQDEECPLCRSSDIVPAGERRGTGEAADGLDGGGPTEVAGESSGPTISEVLGAEGDLLSAYGDYWEAKGDRYRVALPDGSETYVDSKDDVRAVLFEAYGAPA